MSYPLIPSLQLSCRMQKAARLKVINRFEAEKLLALLDKPLFHRSKAENDLQLLSDAVLRQHAEIVFQNDTYYLVDIGSKRGTLVKQPHRTHCVAT